MEIWSLLFSLNILLNSPNEKIIKTSYFGKMYYYIYSIDSKHCNHLNFFLLVVISLSYSYFDVFFSLSITKLYFFSIYYFF